MWLLKEDLNWLGPVLACGVPLALVMEERVADVRSNWERTDEPFVAGGEVLDLVMRLPVMSSALTRSHTDWELCVWFL